MGVDVCTEGNLVIISTRGEVLGREAIEWAAEVKRSADRLGGRVCLLVVLAADTSIPIVQIAAGCRVALPILHLIEATAFVAAPGPHRSLLRAAMSAVSPPYPVGYFDDPLAGREWLRHQAPSAA